MFWIEGWVEITAAEDVPLDEHARAVINVGCLVDVADGISERLFGLSRRCAAGEKSVVALAPKRGIPGDSSDQVRREMESIRNHEEQFGRGGLGGYTYATWREIKTVAFAAEELRDSDWSLLFDLMRRLEEDCRFSADRIRVVVWYNW